MPEVTEEYMAACEAREAAATAGPFVAQYPHGDDFRAVRIFAGATYIASVCNSDMDEDDIKSNAEFFAHARTDVPTLLAEVRRLRCELREALKTSGQYAYESGGVRGVLEAIGWQGGVDATVEGFRAENERLRAEVVRLTAKLETK